ncbi:MAG: phosphate regulon transcriptional regulator PhoB [Alphaproteobacteria bacterium]|nr:phosphate regulon transcriptional regulator PhoB [Alphaproteobacteria bacterium]
MRQPLIYIVEDEPTQVAVLSYNLEKAGYQIVVADDGERALQLVEEIAPDLIILDWMLPQVSGIEICRRLRARPETRRVPIIMLTARGEEGDRVRGLETGADDYVVKPYSPAEMVARVGALLRRSHPGLADEMLEFGGISMDLAQRKVTRAGQPIHLGPTEYRLLLTLMERPRRVLSRAQILDLVWGRDVDIEDRSVDVHIRRLRKALDQPGALDPIRTVRGAGYALDIED